MSKATFETVFARAAEFQARVFPDQTFVAKANHLEREVAEWRRDPSDIMECADVFLLTLACAAKIGFTPEQVLEAAGRKMDINNLRRWSAPDADGVPHHIASEVQS